MSTSIIDYLSRWLSLKFLNQNLGPKKVVKEAEEMEAGVAGTFVNQSDAPACPNCGSITVRNGSCYKCSVCGTSLGCS
jgi:ribonucleoside-diphosphate reductase alpha chain